MASASDQVAFPGQSPRDSCKCPGNRTGSLVWKRVEAMILFWRGKGGLVILIVFGTMLAFNFVADYIWGKG